MIRDPHELGDIVGVWAHPDDESFVMGGLMAAAAQSGARVVCITATRGELGAQDAGRWPLERLAEIRTGEMADALNALGVREHRWLGYVDGSCPSVDEGEAAGRIAEILREVSPRTMITFGPDEFTKHPDHLAVSAWTTQAFGRAAIPGASLYYAAITPEQVDEYIRAYPEINGWAPDTPPSTALEDIAVDLDLDERLVEQKLAALRAHRSQTGPVFARFTDARLRQVMGIERFRLVATT
jgi:LmbE family N-acetylglucosaminyl deacetylase